MASVLLKHLRDPTLGIVGSLLMAWASYIGADAVGVSGVLSTVACGLFMGWRQHTVLTAATRTQAKAVWSVVVFVLESLVFILIGLSLRGVLLAWAETVEGDGRGAPGDWGNRRRCGPDTVCLDRSDVIPDALADPRTEAS